MKTVYVGIFAFIWPLALFTYLKMETKPSKFPFLEDGPGFTFFEGETPEPAANARQIDGIYPSEGANSTIYAGPGKSNPALIVDQKDTSVHMNNVVTKKIKVEGAFEFDGNPENRVKFDKGLNAEGASIKFLSADGVIVEQGMLAASVSATKINAGEYTVSSRMLSPVTLYGYKTVGEWGSKSCSDVCDENGEKLCVGAVAQGGNRQAIFMSDWSSACREKSGWLSHCACMEFWKICEKQRDCLLGVAEPFSASGPSPFEVKKDEAQ